MFKALYHHMGVEVSSSFQHWDTKFISLALDLDRILSQTPVSVTIRRYVTLFLLI